MPIGPRLVNVTSGSFTNPQLNVTFPSSDVGAPIEQGQRIRANRLSINQAERREKLATQIAQGGPQGLDALLQARSLAPDLYKGIVDGQMAAVEMEFKKANIADAERDKFLEGWAKTARMMAEVEDPQARNDLFRDFKERFETFEDENIRTPENEGQFMLDGTAMGQLLADWERERKGQQTEAEKKEAARVLRQHQIRMEGMRQAGRKELEGMRQAGKKESGVRVRTNPATGEQIIEVGTIAGTPGQPLTTTQQSKVQGLILEQRQLLDGINQNLARFRPEWHQMGARTFAKFTALREKVGNVKALSTILGEASDEDRAALDAFTTYKSGVAQQFGQILNQLSGAAVSAQEMARAEGWIPNVGTGILDGDSETEALAKMKRFAEFTQLSIARLNMMLDQGITHNEIQQRIAENRLVSLDAMRETINQEGADHAEKLRKAGIDDDNQIREAVKQHLREKYGI